MKEALESEAAPSRAQEGTLRSGRFVVAVTAWLRGEVLAERGAGVERGEGVEVIVVLGWSSSKDSVLGIRRGLSYGQAVPPTGRLACPDAPLPRGCFAWGRRSSESLAVLF